LREGNRKTEKDREEARKSDTDISIEKEKYRDRQKETQRVIYKHANIQRQR